MADDTEVLETETKDLVSTEDDNAEEEANKEQVEAEDDEAEEENFNAAEEPHEEVQSSRANRRIQTINADKKAAIERAEKAERDMAVLRAQMEEVQRHVYAGKSQQDAATEAALLEQMDPIQRVEYEANKKITAIQSELHKVQLSALDGQDKVMFLAKAQKDPVRSKLMGQVEKNLSDMRAKGLNAPREDIYYYLLGRQLAEQKAKGGGSSEREAARSRVEATQGRTSSIRSDAPSGKRGKTAEDRLDGVLL